MAKVHHAWPTRMLRSKCAYTTRHGRLMHTLPSSQRPAWHHGTWICSESLSTPHISSTPRQQGSPPHNMTDWCAPHSHFYCSHAPNCMAVATSPCLVNCTTRAGAFDTITDSHTHPHTKNSTHVSRHLRRHAAHDGRINCAGSSRRQGALLQYIHFARRNARTHASERYRIP